METLVRRVLAQGAQHNTVLKLDTTDFQWLEQLGERLVVRLRVNRRSRWRPLRGTVVRNVVGSHIVDVLMPCLLSLDSLLRPCALFWCVILDAMVRVGPLGPN
jgi:hypothetical protein